MRSFLPRLSSRRRSRLSVPRAAVRVFGRCPRCRDAARAETGGADQRGDVRGVRGRRRGCRFDNEEVQGSGGGGGGEAQRRRRGPQRGGAREGGRPARGLRRGLLHGCRPRRRRRRFREPPPRPQGRARADGRGADRAEARGARGARRGGCRGREAAPEGWRQLPPSRAAQRRANNHALARAARAEQGRGDGGTRRHRRAMPRSRLRRVAVFGVRGGAPRVPGRAHQATQADGRPQHETRGAHAGERRARGGGGAGEGKGNDVDDDDDANFFDARRRQEVRGGTVSRRRERAERFALETNASRAVERHGSDLRSAGRHPEKHLSGSVLRRALPGVALVRERSRRAGCASRRASRRRGSRVLQRCRRARRRRPARVRLFVHRRRREGVDIDARVAQLRAERGDARARARRFVRRRDGERRARRNRRRDLLGLPMPHGQ